MPNYPQKQVPRKQKWSELTYDHRMKVLVSVIQQLSRDIQLLASDRWNLLRHKHDEKGTPVVVNHISDGPYSQSTEPIGPRLTQTTLLDSFDFSDGEDLPI